MELGEWRNVVCGLLVCGYHNFEFMIVGLTASLAAKDKRVELTVTYPSILFNYNPFRASDRHLMNDSQMVLINYPVDINIV